VENKVWQDSAFQKGVEGIIIAMESAEADTFEMGCGSYLYELSLEIKHLIR